jgi:hypothetical protein
MSLQRSILLTAVLMALLVSAIGPVSAYSISVNPVSSDPVISSGMMSMISGYQSSSQSRISDLLAGVSDTSSSSQGYVSAYSRGTSLGEGTSLDFEQYVRASGLITNFHYSAHFTSGFSFF